MRNELFFYNLTLYYKWACAAAAQTQCKRRQKCLVTLKVKPMLSQVKTWDNFNLLSSTAPSPFSHSCVLSQGPTVPLSPLPPTMVWEWSRWLVHASDPAGSSTCLMFAIQLKNDCYVFVKYGAGSICFISGFHTYPAVNPLHSRGCVLLHTHTKDVQGAGFFRKALCHAVHTQCLVCAGVFNSAQSSFREGQKPFVPYRM